ncbi:MAG: hypothetical protein ACLP4W_22370 [Mycobacterium sp.]|uniref:hypothetical protein n=1 Tax=Mycobacterium sp. TaxID=1785 RepID=UPI003F95B5E1
MPRSDVARQHARVAATARFKPNSPEYDVEKRNLKHLMLREDIRRAVSTWPPLSDEQYVSLAELLAEARNAIRESRLAALQALPALDDAAATK